MTPQTPLEYHDDEESHGSYIFCSIGDIVQELEQESLDPDSYLTNTPRSKIVAKVKEGVREMNRDLKKTVLAREFTVSPSLYFTLPQDYMDWVRVSVIDENGRLQPLNINNKIHAGAAYLQDNDWELLFSQEGEVLTVDSNNAYGKPYKRYEFCPTYRGRQFELDTTKLSVWGEFTIDEHRGKIVFSSNLNDKDIVLEYISDGLQMETLKLEEIQVHKVLKNSIWAYAYAECIRTRRNVPQNEKYASRQRFKTERHNAVIEAANFDMNEIMRFSSGSKQL